MHRTADQEFRTVPINQSVDIEIWEKQYAQTPLKILTTNLKADTRQVHAGTKKRSQQKTQTINP